MHSKAPLQRKAPTPPAQDSTKANGSRSAQPVDFNPTAQTEMPAREAILLAQNNSSVDWTNEQRANLNLGDQIGPDIERRVSERRRNQLGDMAKEMLVEADRRTHPRRPGVITYYEISEMLHTISAMNIPTVEKVVMWNYIGLYARDYTISNTGVREELIDEWAPGATHKHIVLPFTDDYHGEMGGAEGDVNVNLSDVPTPHWIDLEDPEQRAWWNELPSRDSMSEGSGRISDAYRRVLLREDYSFMANQPGWTSVPRAFFGAHRADALASFATIENIRAFRMGGFSGFVNSFDERILRD